MRTLSLLLSILLLPTAWAFSWDLGEEAELLVAEEGGEFTLERTFTTTVEAGDHYQFKLVRDHQFETALPDGWALTLHSPTLGLTYTIDGRLAAPAFFHPATDALWEVQLQGPSEEEGLSVYLVFLKADRDARVGSGAGLQESLSVHLLWGEPVPQQQADGSASGDDAQGPEDKAFSWPTGLVAGLWILSLLAIGGGGYYIGLSDGLHKRHR